MVTEYLNTLKTQKNLSWQEISDMSKVPVQTVRNIFSGDTPNPGITTICSIVSAMGGSMDALAGIEPPAAEQAQIEVTNLRHEFNTMVEKYEARIENTKKSYEQRIVQMCEGHTLQIEQLNAAHTRAISILTESTEKRVKELNDGFRDRITELNNGFAERTKEGDRRFYIVLLFLVLAVCFMAYLFVDAMHGNWGIFRYQEVLSHINPSSALVDGSGLRV